MIFFELLHNITLLVTFNLIYLLIIRRWKPGSLLAQGLSGLLFGVVAVLGMMMPLKLMPGIIFDGRSIVISVAGLFGGPLTAGIAAFICGAYRLYLGGAGTWVGVSVIAEAAIVGSAYHYWSRRNPQALRPLWLFAFGVLVHVIMLALVIGLPGGLSRQVLSQIALPILLLYPPATMLICGLFLLQQTLQRDEDAMHRSEQQYREAEESLRQSEKRYRSLFNGMTEGFALHEIVCDAAGVPCDYCFLEINPAFERLTGLRRENVIGRLQTELLPNEDPKWVEMYGRVALTGEPCQFENYSPVLKRHFEVFAYCPAPRQFAVIFMDITNRKHAEHEIHRLNAELEQRVRDRTAQLEVANKELEAFSYSVSHDLRAPLRHVTGFVELLNKRAPAALDDKSKHYLQVISEAAQQMGQLIDDLLSFSRMGRVELSKTTVNMGQLVQEVLAMLQQDTQEREITWRVDLLPEVSGDPALLKIVLTNLMTNALKFTRNTPQAVIEIGHRADANETIFYVKDNGAGFDMKYVDKLFGLFQRLHRAEEFEGTGLGLANIRRIIHRHGGRVWAEGAVEQGATMYFALPKDTTTN
ncbi:multi-sensor signal transduction histidine kinase [Candidatus Moduliflexus flocculans]|uniref:histidine kinase n=1 Tax=Candidatus Moduliflexus flocculans TaxID=1499966 RepID=A0A081BQ00_9BACT|nr:multi-sensor signal transduction histidine kinase [Candidatus Moduliflexus flocculans]